MLPKGFRRLKRRTRGRWDLYGGCEHLSFVGGQRGERGYDLWTPRKRMRELGQGGLSPDGRVRGVIEVITAPFWGDGLKYVGEEGGPETGRTSSSTPSDAASWKGSKTYITWAGRFDCRLPKTSSLKLK